MGIYICVVRIPYETAFLKIKEILMQKNSGLCLYIIRPLLEATGRTNKKLDKTYSDWLFSQSDCRIRNRDLNLFTAECGGRKKR